jgi:hypothetical protein
MTNTIALYIGITIVLAMGLDLVANDGAALMFLARKFVALVDWVAFWR